MVPLLVKQVTRQQLQRLQIRHHCEEKLRLLVLEVVYLLYDLTVRAFDNLIAQLLGQVIQQFLLLREAVSRLLIVFQMALDLRVHAQWYVSPCTESLKHCNLLIECVSLGIETLN